MEVREFSSVDQFLGVVGPFLYAKESENNLLLGLLTSNPSKWDVFHMYSVFENNSPVLCGFQNAMGKTYFPLGMTNTSKKEAIKELFQFLSLNHRLDHVDEVVAINHVAEYFVELYNAAFPDKTMKLSKRERSHLLTTVNPEYLKPGEGELKIATEEDSKKIKEWYLNFLKDIDNEDQAPTVNGRVALETKNKNIFLWVVNGTPVAMAMATRSTENVGSITQVYTPPENRSKGYASRMVAHLAEYIQKERKKKYCCLFTDLANPTANSIYKKVGFEPEMDLLMYQH